MTKYPTISVVIPTFNSELYLYRVLKSIRIQDYPPKKIEIVIVDGGSKDKTIEIVRSFNIKPINVDPKKQNVELNKYYGIKKARGEILFLLDHDNILPHKKLIQNMVKPFLDDDNIIGVETMRYQYIKNASLLDRYIALYAVTDPLALYLGKADRVPYFLSSYYKKYYPYDAGKYYVVEFSNTNIPTLGANGFMIRRNKLISSAKVTPDKFFHIDVNVDLIKKGFNRYAFIKDSIAHLGGRGNIISYIGRRMMFMRQYYFNKDNKKMIRNRRYSLYEKKVLWRLVYFVIASSTFVIPIFDSIRGYTKIRDSAWFIHPILCFGFLLCYSYVVIEHQIKSSIDKLHKSK